MSHASTSRLVLAGVTDAIDGPRLQHLRGPVLFVHSRNNHAVPYGPALDTCATVDGWKRMLTVENLRGLRAHVFAFLGHDEYAAIVRPATVDFFDGYLRDDADGRADVWSKSGAGPTGRDRTATAGPAHPKRSDTAPAGGSHGMGLSGSRPRIGLGICARRPDSEPPPPLAVAPRSPG